MEATIIINSEETVICPSCSHKFPLHQGITQQTIQRYEKDHEKHLNKQVQQLQAKFKRDAAKAAEKTYKTQISGLQLELDETKDTLKGTESRIKKVKKEARIQAKKDLEDELKNLSEELDEKGSIIKKLKANELKLRKEKNRIEEEKEDLELEIQRRLDEAKKEIQQQADKTAIDKFKLKEAEYKKRLGDAQKANEELTRKLEQGSQQLKGEVLELEIEDLLKKSFPYDVIEAVAKGARGADILQRVYTPTGQLCGTIIWEAKRAKNWSDKWIQKLKDDRLKENAEVAVIVSNKLPKDADEQFHILGDIWVTTYSVIKPVAETLRVILIQAFQLKSASIGKNEKMEFLYDYLCSPNFAQKVGSVVETFSTMKQDLDREKNAMFKYWKKRESQLERVAVSMSSMVGELQAIAHDSLIELEGIEQLSLPENT